jgi:hypothetical protein
MDAEIPQYQHTCTTCTFLGRCTWEDRTQKKVWDAAFTRHPVEFDLYHCTDHFPKAAHEPMPTVVARFGHEEDQAYHGADIIRMQFNMDSPPVVALTEALKRAMARKLSLI